MLKFSSMNDTTVRPFHVRAGKSGLRHPAHSNVLSGGLLGNVWGSGWRRWWWLRKIDLLSVPFSPPKSSSSSQFRDVFQLSSFDEWTNGGSEAKKVRILRKCLTPTPMNDTTVSPFHVCAGIAQMSNYRRDYFGSCFSTLWMRGQSCFLSVLVPPIDFVFVCADLWLLCCSCFGGVSPAQLVFSVCCDCWWILVSICECAASLKFILDRLLFISMEVMFITVSIIGAIISLTV